MDVLDNFLITLIANRSIECEIIKKATDVIFLNSGRNSYVNLTDELHVNRRTLQRLFKKHIGVSPIHFDKHQSDFSEGVSMMIKCSTQDEIDHVWNHFTEEGEESMCGWAKDTYGVRWQVIPDILETIMKDPERAGKAAEAFMTMRKLYIEQIIQASLRR